MQKLIGKMARMYPALIAMGFMIVVAALVIGYVNSQTAEAYFSASKSVRETTMMSQRAFLESTGQWLPYFKFLGLGFILGGIVMALRVIIDRLKAVGEDVLDQLPEDVRPDTPEAPWYGRLMPVVMMLGEMIFVGALAVGVWLASLAGSVFSNPIPAIDAAGPGSVLLTQLQTIQTVGAWLVPLKFFAVATEFLAIAMGLGTIVFLLTQQTKLLDRGVQIGKDRSIEVGVNQRESERVTS